MRVEFPADVREDIKIAGLKMRDFFIFLGSVCVGVFCLFIPIPVIIRLILLFLVPSATFLTLFFDLPVFIKRRQGYKKEPSPRTAAEGERNVQEIVAVKSADDPYVNAAGHMHIFLSVTPPPWHTKTEAEKAQAGLAWAQAVVRVLNQGGYIDAYALSDLEILRSEFSRQEKAQKKLPEALRSFGEARRRYWAHLQEIGAARTYTYCLRISVDPFALDIHPKPKSKAERYEKTKQILAEIAKDVVEKLRATGAHAVIMSAELVRDFAARQLRPDLHREFDHVRGSDWIRPEEAEAPPATVPEKEKSAEKKFTLRPALPVFKQKLIQKKAERKEAVEKQRDWKGVVVPFMYRITRPIRRMLPPLKNTLNIVYVKRFDVPGMRGLNQLISDMYLIYQEVYLAPFEFSGPNTEIPVEVDKAFRSGYVLAVFLEPDEHNDYEIKAVARTLRAAAARYGCKIDIFSLYPDGALEPVAY